jgi:hypothetical protein
MSQYRTTVTQALATLRLAIAHARVHVPHSLLTQHFVLKNHDQAPWVAVEAHYRQEPDADPVVLATLADLALMDQALACLTTITTSQVPVDAPINLKLAPTRRAS